MSIEPRQMNGRRVIYTDYDYIDESNVVEVLHKTANVHQHNASDIEYLYNYYKGIQPILQRTKDERAEICNKIVENRANEIVSFKVGYLMGEPIQYVNRSSNEGVGSALNILNEYVFAEDKAAKDKELADWFTICGTSYRMILPDSADDVDEAPFEIYTLDPRFTYVVYHTGLGNKPVMAVKYVVTVEHGIIYSVYTKDGYFEIVDGQIVKSAPHYIGEIPIIEYPANKARLGAFEIVLPLLDALNNIESNRIDGVEQFIQAYMMIKGVDMDAEDMKLMRELGGIKVPVDGDIKYLSQELNQTQTQTLVDYIYQSILTICGMPNRNGG